MLPTVLILGGRGDIGSAIVKRFADAGHPVIATGRDDMDLGNPDSIDAWFSAPRSDFGVLVHCAGHNDPKIFDELSQKEIDHSMEVNVNGFLRVLRHAMPGLTRTKGRVVVISSLYGFLARKGRLPYVMSKHALVGAVKTLALEYASKNVLFNTVSPGYIDTKMTHKNNDAETVAKLVSQIPMQAMGLPADVADAVFFLGSKSNRYITGQDLVVDGGFSINGGR